MSSLLEMAWDDVPVLSAITEEDKLRQYLEVKSAEARSGSNDKGDWECINIQLGVPGVPHTKDIYDRFFLPNPDEPDENKRIGQMNRTLYLFQCFDLVPHSGDNEASRKKDFKALVAIFKDVGTTCEELAPLFGAKTVLADLRAERGKDGEWRNEVKKYLLPTSD